MLLRAGNDTIFPGDSMAKNRYTIGEVAEMMGVSVQTIRYYCKIGLIRPAYTNGETGYRYFAPEQLHYIDRIRYLTKCGLSLKDIQQIIAGNDIDLLTRRLAEEKDRQLQRIREAANLVAAIDWYRDYFQEARLHRDETITYQVRHYPARSIVTVQWGQEQCFEDFYAAYGQVRNRPEYSTVQFYRQFYSLWQWDPEQFEAGTPRCTHTGMMTMELLPSDGDGVVVLPEGEYYCYRSRILEHDWRPEVLHMITSGRGVPRCVATLEIEDDLTSYQHCQHEVQILF